MTGPESSRSGSLLAANGEETTRHEFRHAFLDGGKILPLASAAGELVNPAGACEREVHVVVTIGVAIS